MGTDIKRKPVAFNIEDPDQRKLYEHCIQRTNFSYYIKTLILRDMEGKNVIKSVQSEGNSIDVVQDKHIDISSFI